MDNQTDTQSTEELNKQDRNTGVATPEENKTDDHKDNNDDQEKTGGKNTLMRRSTQLFNKSWTERKRTTTRS
ncbi:hypothetical protein [Companilactobacillus ginsenosidimutans]|uniref:Uncharacterized protein n=1 Tax=Companilactobacillus ginsenosidimutans TaxID=1007676 RepID=A0A0H4QIT4_9LACO|nr:hypothetical protein [Companilactobacillus ginsenosidimutans]AKP68344.1 hypothetical protein ABM34_12875 [Companilactobacillus ginsenosidimutans]